MLSTENSGSLLKGLPDVYELLVPILHLTDCQDEVVRFVQRREDLIPGDRYRESTGDTSLHLDEP